MSSSGAANLVGGPKLQTIVAQKVNLYRILVNIYLLLSVLPKAEVSIILIEQRILLHLLRKT